MAIKLNKGVIYLKSITGISGPTYCLRAMSQRTHFSDNRQIITVRLRKGYGFTGVCLSTGGGVYHPGRQTLPVQTPPRQTPPWADTPPEQTPPRWLLQRMVHILLERILVLRLRVFARGCNVKFCSGKCPVHNVLFTHYSLIFVWCVILPNCNLV